ncbi:alanine racemase [Alteromonas lipolytica]|uniref:Alanine racemase n=1 Tax=Alteromonas lipolytica TaxID=1856405 RepID=A0A1E8F958_9ALTE|nr:alanine racemase [Alteromonas lipolytica]OFI32440.1 alanine racemase [Alteromonas lipolytica]GGF79635.1 alanine racemase, biosynthetic [Alteromonas lipolytica]
MSRSTRASINLQAIRDNFNQLRPPTGKAIAVIKADAYGHGAVTVASALSSVCDYFAIAICDEAAPLREAGIKQPLLVLEGPHHVEDCKAAKAHQLILLAHNREQLDWLDALGSERPRVWLKVDTGMHRLGFACEQVAPLLQHYPWLREQPTVLASHFACADEPDNPNNALQLKRFTALTQTLGLAGCMANSAASLCNPQSLFDYCRLGIGLYGASPVTGHPARDYNLTPVMSLQAQIIALHQVKQGETVGYSQTWTAPRDSLIATVGIGYADGYPRHCPSGTPVVVRSQRASLVGRVSMDMITIDVTEIPGVTLGDDVELWGQQLPVDEVADFAGTISYELITRVSARVPRLPV